VGRIVPTTDASLAPAIAFAIPEPNQLVHVRDRHWLVTDVAAAVLPNSPSESSPAEHLVQLSSVDDDGLGEELKVFWELESDARVLPRATLPTPRADHFDEPDHLAAFLDAVRWGAVASADIKALQAPFRSGITIEDYQLDPVVRALDMPRVNLLIADDVGLGKTIEAGLVIQELLLRHRARTVMILCPPSLRGKWQREMLDKFGLHFEIIDAERVRRFRRERGVGENVLAHFPRVIVSFDWLKGDRGKRLLRNTLPTDRNAYPRRFDILVVDEVHQCSPAGTGNGTYATDTLRTQLLLDLAPHVEHRLFLSATPHNGYANSYVALLALLDPQRFWRGVPPDPEAISRAVVRRMKADILHDLPPTHDGIPRFPIRKVRAFAVRYGKDEREAHAALQAYAAERKEKANSEAVRVACDLTTLLLKKRLFSSPAAFASTLDVHLRSLNAAANAAGSTDTLRARFAELDDDFDSDEDLNDATETALREAARVSKTTSPEKSEHLKRLRVWAERARYRPDAKAETLVRALRRWCTPHSHGNKRPWNMERVVIFTEYRDTQKWLYEFLTQRGLGGDRLALLYGGMNEQERDRIIAEFQAEPTLRPVRILLATDTASEGIDLQKHCRLMVHVEIPFNPNRLEQRNGRIDRHGQRHPEVRIYHFVGAEYEEHAQSLEADLEFLSRAAKKVERIRDDLGDAGAVLAGRVERAMLGERVDLDAAQPTRRASRSVLKIERQLRERVAMLRERLDTSVMELGITPPSVERVVRTALKLARQAPLEDTPKAFGLYDVPELTRSWAGAAANLYDEIRGRRLPVTFDANIAARRDDVVLAHLGHRLVAQSLRLLRAEMWSAASGGRLARVTGALVADEDIDAPTVILHARLVIAGTDGVRLHEELFTASGRLSVTGFSRALVGETETALDARRVGVLPNHHRTELATLWPNVVSSVQAALDARANIRTSSLERTLMERAEREEKILRSVLDDLAASIRTELAREERGEAEQLRLFEMPSDAERTQLRRDLDTMRERLNELPGEAERDSQRLRSRYAAPRPFVFPAALEFLVPARLAAHTLFTKAVS